MLPLLVRVLLIGVVLVLVRSVFQAESTTSPSESEVLTESTSSPSES